MQSTLSEYVGDPSTSDTTPQPYTTDADYIRLIKDVAEMLGHSPTQAEFDENRPSGAPTAGAITHRYDGTWNALKKAAGLKQISKTGWTEQECIDYLNEVAAQIDWSPSKQDYYDHFPEGGPSPNTFVDRFGSWTAAKEAAGCSHKDIQRARSIKALKEVASDLGYSPSLDIYDEHKPDWAPCSRTIASHFGGSWSQAKREAELQTRDFSTAECLESLQFVSETLGASPTVEEYESNRPPDAPSSTTIIDRVGSWNEAKRAKNLEINKNTDITTEDCGRAVLHVSESIGHSPTEAEYILHKPVWAPSATTIKERYGSWRQAKRELDLEVDVFTDDECLTALIAVAEDLGQSPSMRDYMENRNPGAPVVGTFANKFGTWSQAKRLVGLKVYNDGSGHSYPYGPSWPTIREEILERDGKCQKCGLTIDTHRETVGRAPDVHHIHKLASFFEDIPDQVFSELEGSNTLSEESRRTLQHRSEIANHPSNLVTLCRYCHGYLENKPVKRQLHILGIPNPEVSPENIPPDVL